MVADGPITARYRFIKNASWVTTVTVIVLLARELVLMLHNLTCQRDWCVKSMRYSDKNLFKIDEGAVI